MKPLHALSTAIILFLVFSCSSDEEMTEKKCYITKISFSAQSDDFEDEKTFTYTNGKVTSFIDEETESGNTEIGETTLTYNSKSQITQITTIWDGIDSDTYIITYDANGLPDKMVNGSSELDFTFNSSNQLVRIGREDYSTVFEYSSTTTNNYNKSKFYINNVEEEVTIYQYDDKRNMLESLGWLPLFYDFSYDYDTRITDNNITKISKISPDSWSNTFSYQYDTKGYPISITDDGSTIQITYDCK